MAAAYLFHLCQELVDLVLGVACGVIKKPALIDMFESRCSPGRDFLGARGGELY